MLTFLDLFAGVGGFREGMEMAGFKCLGYCEFDRFASASYRMMHTVTDEQREYLQKNFLKVPNIRVKGLQWFENHELNKKCKTKLQKELEKEVYLNGEWYANDIRNVTAGNIPHADVWCFGAPCQDFSIAGARKGMAGDRSCLVREVFRILGELKEADKPKYIIYENVMGMLSSEKGFDFAGILLEMESHGYDIEFQNLNSKYHGVPQNRDRVYTIGHLRGRSTTTVFPFGRCDQEDSSKRVTVEQIGHAKDGYEHNGRVYSERGVSPCLSGREYKDPSKVAICVNQIGRMTNYNRDNPQAYRVYDTDGLSPCLNTCDGGGREPHVLQVCNVNPSGNGELKESRHNMTALEPRTDGISSTITTVTKDNYLSIMQKSHGFNKGGEHDISPTLTSNAWEQNNFLVSEVESNIDNHNGIYVEFPNGVKAYAIWYKKYKCYVVIRKLTPRECWRLQGWSDFKFECAALVNSDNQLYKQAGNGVTVTVVYEIAKRLKED